MYGNTNMYKRVAAQLDEDLYEELKAHGAIEKKLRDDIRAIKNDYVALQDSYYQCIKDNAEVGALNVDLQEELQAYRVIETKTGKSPEEIIDMVSNLQGVVDAIRTRSPKCKCSGE